MNWEAIGAIGETIGALAVVATLFYVAVQLREAKKATNRNSEITLAATYQSRAEASQKMMINVADSEYVAPLLARIREGGGFTGFPIEDLSEVEKGRIRAFSQAMRIALDNQHYQFERGFLDQEYYKSSVLPSIASMIEIWDAVDGTPLRPSFENLVDELRSTGPRDSIKFL